MSVLGVYPFYWCIPLVYGPLESACVCVCVAMEIYSLLSCYCKRNWLGGLSIGECFTKCAPCIVGEWEEDLVRQRNL